MPFSPPKRSAFKQFVILDSDGVVSALSAIDGGQIDEILTRSAEERDGGLEGGVDVGPVRAKGKRSKGRKVEEEIRRARTRHATAAKLLEALLEKEAIGIVDGPFDEQVAQQIQPGMVLQFRARIQLHPLHQADQMLRSFIQVAPKMGEKKAAAELKEMLPIWEVVSGSGREGAPVLLEPITSDPQAPRLLLPVPKIDLEVSIDAVLSDLTVVAQVEQIVSDAETYEVVRVLSGGPATPLEQGAVKEMLPGLSKALSSMGIAVDEEDALVRGPAVILRAICAYR